MNRPNLFINVPATAASVPAIEELLFEGNVNITLLFSIERYEAVARAYMRALERRLAAGKPVDSVASVASFFLSRVDVLVDRLLRHRIVPARSSSAGPSPEALLGKAAIANAKLAYQSFKRMLASEDWKQLADRGGRPQRMLWASTSTKNPAYGDLLYVEPLIAALAINTMPVKTIAAFRDHGKVEGTVEQHAPQARRVMTDLERLGIRFELVTEQLENEGIEKFIAPFDAALGQLAVKRERVNNFMDLHWLQEVARKLRRLVIRMTTEAGSEHPTSCLSCADIMAALFFHEMRWDPTDPAARNVDTFILSKGTRHQSHACLVQRGPSPIAPAGLAGVCRRVGLRCSRPEAAGTMAIDRPRSSLGRCRHVALLTPVLAGGTFARAYPQTSQHVLRWK